ncbi:hypothetical protein THOM_0447 [Trachipleistophora hominis]|uniref:Uncharacterized protein n=1 Tax=Trachipleistophora hominis TaxID=72359 RepID=L7JYN0_TRAHO|nr:hypothetical protein THOM_0447 [Trachipleistophora hominis]
MKLFQHEFFKQGHLKNVVIEVQSEELADNPTMCNTEILYERIRTLKFSVDYRNNELQPKRSIDLCLNGNINQYNKS